MMREEICKKITSIPNSRIYDYLLMLKIGPYIKTFSFEND